MSKKINLAVLMGGKSSEHKISLMTGEEIVKNIDPKKYNVLPIIVDKTGVNWSLESSRNYIVNTKKETGISLQNTSHASIIKKNRIDLVFIAMHGAAGENGSVQGFLELLGVKYTGSGVLSSSICMDKSYTKLLLSQAGILTPKGVEIIKGTRINYSKIKYPVFVKPSDQGSSVGSSIATNSNQLRKSLKLAFKYSSRVLVEEYLAGTEITCAILGNTKLRALPLVEIVSKNQFFDYESKYNPKLSDEICPARIPSHLAKKASDIAVRAYGALGCKAFGRVDMIISSGKIYVLEANTIPGLTSVSLFPKAAKAAGISYPKLLEKIIRLSMAN